jgi:hypothetical protein
MVIDYDAIAGALGGGHGPASVARNALIRSMQNGKLDVGVVWLISANPKSEDLFPSHRVHLIDPGLVEIERRTRAGDLGSDGVRRLELARQWYAARSLPTEQKGTPSRDW